MRGLRDWVNEAPGRRMAIIATHRRTTASRADRIYHLAAASLPPLDPPSTTARAAR
jgi:hypothetical protein